MGKESTTVSTFENGGEASLCPTTHMPSSQETRAPRRSINQRHVVSCGDGERANGRMKGPVGGRSQFQVEEDGVARRMRDKSQHQGWESRREERCCRRWFARRWMEIQATMPPFFSAARLTSACFSVKGRLEPIAVGNAR